MCGGSAADSNTVELPAENDSSVRFTQTHEVEEMMNDKKLHILFSVCSECHGGDGDMRSRKLELNMWLQVAT